MTDTIDAVRAELTRAGKPEQVQWSDAQVSWQEGVIVCSRDGDAILLRQLGRGEADDRLERFGSEDAAASHLRRRLLDVPARLLTPEEGAAVRKRMATRAEETKARIRSDRGLTGEAGPETSGAREQSTSTQVEALLGALGKLPAWRGVSYRGQAEGSVFGRDGNALVTRVLTATSRDVRIATENFTSGGLNVVLGRTGRPIETLSSKPHEQEVVFLPGTLFLAVDRFRVGDLPITVVEQLNPELGQLDDALASLDDIRRLTAARVLAGQQGEPATISTPGKFSGVVE